MPKGDWPGITRLNDAILGVAAGAYAAAGIPVFPLFGMIETGIGRRCECPTGPACDRPGKHPRVAWRTLATMDPGTVREWWERWPSANIGAATGYGSWAVVDLDTREVEHRHLIEIIDGEAEFGTLLERELGPGALERLLETTLVQRTGGGGKQLILLDPGGVGSVTGWLSGVDIKAGDPERGGAGYAVLPPSRHASGRAYAWLNENSPGPAPDRLTALLRTARSSARAHHRPDADTDAGDGGAWGDDYRRARLDGPAPGMRDEFFNRYAFELRKRGWTRTDALDELRRIWDRTPGGGVPSGDPGTADPYRWETVVEKIERIWRAVDPDPAGREPVADELVAWARGATSQPGGDGAGGLGDDPPPPAGGARVVGEPPERAELATDLGTASRYARVNRDRLRFVPGVGWFVWTGTHWRPDELNYAVVAMDRVIADIRRQAERSEHDEAQRWTRWALACESAARIFSVVRLAETLPELVVPADSLDGHPHLLCCPNGVVDLATGELLEHDRGLYITSCTGVEYSPDAVNPGAAPLLDEFHAMFLPDPEVREYVYQTIGAALWGGNRGKRFVVITGGTGTGKSMWTAGVKAAVGTYAASVNSSVFRGTLGDSPRPDLLHVVRKRLAIAEEGSKQWELHTDQVKRITGGDSIVARGMRSNLMIERVPDFTPLLVTNEMPHIKGADSAVRRRILALPFSTQVANEDITKKTQFIRDEATRVALLALLVRGCITGSVHADISTAPHAVMLTTMDAFDSLDDVMQFITSLRESGRLVEDSRLRGAQCASTSDLHAEYARWVSLHGSAEDRRNRLGIKHFSQRLKQMGWEQTRSNGTRWVGKALGSTVDV